MRGYVSAYDAKTGKMRWRTTRAGEPGCRDSSRDAMRRAAATWKGEWWKGGGGGTPWDAIVYDPELQLVSSAPAMRTRGIGIARRLVGTTCMAVSILALRADTGEQCGTSSWCRVTNGITTRRNR